jgi:hypothetical protein
MAGCYENGNEPSGSIKCGKLLHQLMKSFYSLPSLSPQALQSLVALGFQYYHPPFLQVFGHRMPVSFSHDLEILLNLISPMAAAVALPTTVCIILIPCMV